jgi:3-ketosteroid 9alpha-monooxygenase subunit B
VTAGASEIPSPGRAHRLRVRRIIEETHDAKSIVLDVPKELEADFRYKAGQFLTLSIPVNGMTLRRCYSLASSPDVDGEHKVTVKRVAGGRASNWLNETLREGDLLEVERPAGRFVLSTENAPVVLFGGGSGITPLISIAKTALHTTDRSVELLYANRDERSIIFREELAALLHKFAGRISVTHWLDDTQGFLKAGNVKAGPSGAHHYLCGPGPFMDVVESALLSACVPRTHLHVERFVSPADPSPAKSPPPELFSGDVPVTLRVEHEGTTVDVPYVPGQTLLESAIEGGVEAPYSCKEGFCGCCAALLLEGEVTMDADDALTPEAKKRGLILACQSRPKTKRCSFRFVEY